MAEHIEPSSPAVAKKGIGKGPVIGGVVVIAAMAVGGGVALRHAKAHTRAVSAEKSGAGAGPEGEGQSPAGAAAAGEEGAKAAEEPGVAAAEPVHEGGEEESSLVTMAPFVVNLDDDSGEMHYLKCTVAVQLAAPSHAKAFEAATPKTRNAVLFYLSSLKVSDTQGLENKKKILEHLRSDVREAAGKGAVADVYLTEFVIQ